MMKPQPLGSRLMEVPRCTMSAYAYTLVSILVGIHVTVLPPGGRPFPTAVSNAHPWHITATLHVCQTSLAHCACTSFLQPLRAVIHARGVY